MSSNANLESVPASSLGQEAEKEKQLSEPEGKQKWTSTNPAPDGGIAAWSVLLGCWLVLVCSFGWINSKVALLFEKVFLELKLQN